VPKPVIAAVNGVAAGRWLACSAMMSRSSNASKRRPDVRRGNRNARHRVHEATARGDAIDGRNHRLRHPKDMAEQRGQFIRVSLARALRARPWVESARSPASSPAQKRTAGSGNNDADHAFISGGAIDRVANLLDHRIGKCVEFFGTVEPHDRD